MSPIKTLHYLYGEETSVIICCFQRLSFLFHAEGNIAKTPTTALNPPLSWDLSEQIWNCLQQLHFQTERTLKYIELFAWKLPTSHKSRMMATSHSKKHFQQAVFLVKDHATITPNRWPKDTWFKGCSVSAARSTFTRLEKRESKSKTRINYLQKNRPPLFQHVGTPLALEQSEVYSMWFQFLHTKGERGNTHKTIQNLAYLHFPV